ncbi:hypothetical protein IG631_11691 [Alternaria alternata]|nr:hypothetical protein IG631_11691 [Alternaria alternata]
MLTYLDRSSSQHRPQRAECFMVVTVARARGLTIKTASSLLPGQVMDYNHILAPEDGSAVGHRQHACVDETCQRNGPRLACAYGCFSPGAVSTGTQRERLHSRCLLTSPCVVGSPH